MDVKIILAAMIFIMSTIPCYETASKKHFFKEKEKLKQWGSTKKKPLQKMKDKLKLEQVTAEKSSEEGKRVCQALREEALPDFFLKFGLVVSMVDDVNSFKRQMKMSGGDVGENGWWRKKRGQEEDKYLYKAGKSGLAKPNYLLEKQRAREDRGYMPPCYGFHYLDAVDGLMQSSTGLISPDVSALQEMLSDIADVQLSNKLSTILDECAAKKEEEVCPKMFYSKPKKALLKSSECVDACVSDSSCATGEKCCKTSCGGRACHDLRLAAKKYRSENKCRKADEFMMCIYANVAQRVCTERRYQ